MEKNLINNRILKENIADTTVKLLQQNNLITTEELKTMKIEFGYLFSLESGEIEAIYKIALKENTLYFAVQKGKIMNIEINENIYENTIENMRTYHPCINKIELDETQTQKNRREKNNAILKQKGIICYDELQCLPENRKLKDIDTICKRAIACLLVVQVACDINYGRDLKKSLEIINPIIDKYGVRDAINSKERRILDGTYSQQDCYDMDWAYEAYWSLCWILGLIEDISDGSACCDCDMAMNLVAESNSFEEFKNKCKIREINEILDMEDLYFRYNWAINENKVNPNAQIGDLNPSNVIERRRGLDWALSDIDDWYELALNA